MMKIAIFDFDGTLADTFPWFLKHINVVAQKMRFKEVTEGEIPLLREMSVQEILSYLHIRPWKVPLVIHYMRRLMSQDRGEITLFPGVSELLRELHRKDIKIAILSSNSEENVRKIMKEDSQYVSSFHCGAGLRNKKKHFRKIKKHHPHTQFISIGDELRDYEAAHEEGIPHLNVGWGFASRKAFGELEVIEDFAHLEARILRYFNMES